MEMQVKVGGFDDLRNRINTLIHFLGDPSRFFAESKLIMFQDVMRHFQEEEGPDGPWEPLKMFTMVDGKPKSYRNKKKGAGRAMILQDTGRLKGSIVAVSSFRRAQVGTNLAYARAHQHGYEKRNLPARPFVWLDDDAKQRIVDRFMFHVRKK